jgi:mannose-6-phosphate isomerase-like protein (cupin superfamily)
MSYTIIQRDELPRDGSSYEFQGFLYSDTAISFILVDAAPGSGPRLHKHPYAEVFIVQEGRATYTVGADTIEVQAGQIVVAPPNVPHKFVNSGAGPLKQVDIHLNTRFVTEWLEDER